MPNTEQPNSRTLNMLSVEHIVFCLMCWWDCWLLVFITHPEHLVAQSSYASQMLIVWTIAPIYIITQTQWNENMMWTGGEKEERTEKRQQMIKNVYFTPLGELKRRKNQIRSYSIHSFISYAQTMEEVNILLARRAFFPSHWSRNEQNQMNWFLLIVNLCLFSPRYVCVCVCIHIWEHGVLKFHWFYCWLPHQMIQISMQQIYNR